ncbi:hypothetical protein E4T48_01735 [Aureobasidium sp. EXF-10727]|nr:hypothetical protein E4T48_01735 [Aureobasidium sp. EXF-10727]
MQSSVAEDLLQALSTQVMLPESLVLGLLLLCIGFIRVWHQKKITGSKGRTMKVLKIKDLRLKLLTSAEISNQGRQLAGDEPYLIRCGPYEELVISQPDQIHDFYQGDYKRHGKPQNFNLGELFGRFMGTAVGLRYGEDWRKIRKHFDPPFAFHAVAQRIPRFQREIGLWIDELAQDSIKGDAFDDRLYWQLLELSESHDHVVHALMTCKGHDSKVWSKFPTATRRLLDRFLNGWKDLNREVIGNAREGKWECPLEVTARGYIQSDDMTEEEFLSTLGEILFANVDVSASVLSTTFRNLAKNPELQNQLRAEINQSKADAGFDMAKYLTNSKALLHRVVMESMRLAPAFWFSMPETTAEEKTIGGFNIPANTTVIIDNQRLNEGTVTWGADGDHFRPNRFLEVSAQAQRCGFMRFGTGAASGRCLGKNAADVVFKLTIIAVIERFRLETLADDGKDMAQSKREVPDVRFVEC